MLMGQLVICTECGQRVLEEAAEAAGWRYWSDGIDLHPFCAPCGAREFSPDAASSRRNAG